MSRSLWPFRRFADASQGALIARAGPTAHNQRMSQILPRYLRRCPGH